jgi:hypothetical protein
MLLKHCWKSGNIQQMMLGEVDKSIETYRKLVASYPINTYTIQAQRQRWRYFQKQLFQLPAGFHRVRQIDSSRADMIQSAAEVQFELADCYTLSARLRSGQCWSLIRSLNITQPTSVWKRST